ncbi:MAG: hypothetical protein ACR2NU_10975 [Aeoliella sp.]
MMLYIAFIASLNLCVGYALGVYIGVLPGVERRNRDELGEEGPIGLAAPAEIVSAEPTAVQPPMPESVRSPAITIAPAPVEEDPVAPPALASASLHDDASVPGASKTDDILAGLSSFREQLASVSQGIRESSDDRESVDQSAGKLKKANDSYLEKAHEVIDSIDADEGATVSSDNLTLKESLVEQTDTLEHANAQIADILADDDPAQAREKLLASAEQLSTSAEEFHEALPTTTGTPTANDPAAAEPLLLAAGLVGIDHLIKTIDRFLADAGTIKPLQVASVVFDKESPEGGALEQTERLLTGLGQVVEHVLAEDQMAALDNDGHLLLLLTGDDEEAATRRCEQARQQVVATQFISDGKPLQATVSCAITDSGTSDDRSVVLKHLEEALDEAARYGSNRTFHHDGKFPAPVVPQSVETEPLEIEV